MDELDQVKELMKLAEGGSIYAIDRLGLMYLNGDGVEADPEKTVYWFRKGAEAGYSNHMFNLGLFYAKGYGVQRNFSLAAEWMEKAEEYGDPDAEIEAKQYRALAEWLVQAEKGDADAQADAAEAFMKLGKSLDQADRTDDYRESIRLAEKAAAQNNAKGIWILGLAYEHGRGVEKSLSKAVEYFQKGAEMGYGACENSLGKYLFDGEVLEKDEDRGFELFAKAAEHGYPLAMKNLGRCFQFGHGCQEDMNKAIEWYEKYLTIQNDPELAQKLPFYKQLVEEEKKMQDQSQQMPEDYQNAMAAFIEADMYEKELYEAHYCPDLPEPTDQNGPIGKDQYPRVLQKATENDEKARNICKALGWDKEKTETKEESKTQREENKKMANNEGSRIKIGNFFTLIGRPGMLMEINTKEKIEEKDAVVTMFDTTGGRELEIGIWGLTGLPDGLEITLIKLMDIPEEKINQLFLTETKNEGFTQLVSRSDLSVVAWNDEFEGEKIRLYYIVTRKGIFYGSVHEAPQLELTHYDQVLSSVLPLNVT